MSLLLLLDEGVPPGSTSGPAAGFPPGKIAPNGQFTPQVPLAFSLAINPTPPSAYSVVLPNVPPGRIAPNGRWTQVPLAMISTLVISFADPSTQSIQTTLITPGMIAPSGSFRPLWPLPPTPGAAGGAQGTTTAEIGAILAGGHFTGSCTSTATAQPTSASAARTRSGSISPVVLIKSVTAS